MYCKKKGCKEGVKYYRYFYFVKRDLYLDPYPHPQLSVSIKFALEGQSAGRRLARSCFARRASEQGRNPPTLEKGRRPPLSTYRAGNWS